MLLWSGSGRSIVFMSKLKQTNMSTDCRQTHTALRLPQIRVCCRTEPACCSIAQQRQTKCLQQNNRIYPPPPHTHLTCDLHQHTEAITDRGTQIHTHSPSRSSSGAWMWQAAVTVPRWCRQRFSHTCAWVNRLSLCCCCCCCCCCTSLQLLSYKPPPLSSTVSIVNDDWGGYFIS